jgi:hypothetical protein
MELMRAHGPVVSLALLGDIEDDTAFLTGYRKAGGRADFGPAARRRLALYRSYLYLIMLIETVPRAVGDDDVVWTRKVVAPQLVAALDDIGRRGAGRSNGWTRAPVEGTPASSAKAGTYVRPRCACAPHGPG